MQVKPTFEISTYVGGFFGHGVESITFMSDC